MACLRGIKGGSLLGTLSKCSRTCGRWCLSLKLSTLCRIDCCLILFEGFHLSTSFLFGWVDSNLFYLSYISSAAISAIRTLHDTLGGLSVDKGTDFRRVNYSHFVNMEMNSVIHQWEEVCTNLQDPVLVVGLFLILYGHCHCQCHHFSVLLQTYRNNSSEHL